MYARRRHRVDLPVIAGTICYYTLDLLFFQGTVLVLLTVPPGIRSICCDISHSVCHMSRLTVDTALAADLVLMINPYRFSLYDCIR